MKKKLLAGLATGVFMLGLSGLANANTITGTGHIYNMPGNRGVIDDWFFNVGSTGSVSIDISYLSGEGFDSEIFLLTNNLSGLAGETIVAHNDDYNGLASHVDLNNLASGNYHLRVSEYSFDDAYMTFENSVGGDWYYNLAIQGNNVSFDGGTPTPEPATMLLLGSGLAGLVASRRKKKAQA